MAWSESASLAERFATAVPLVSQRTLGRTYQGLIKASRRLGPTLLRGSNRAWREVAFRLLGRHWASDGWVVMGVDGTKLDLPRTAANEKAFGVSGKRHGGPQAYLCTVLHLASGLPWCWKIGRAAASERSLLRQMIPRLPAGCLLVADAGFTGYALWRRLEASGHSLLIRAGANVHLLRSLGCEVKTKGQRVYLWPARAQRDRQPPLVLRLIRIHDGRRCMCLLTNVLDDQRLSDVQAAKFYHWRWGIELWFRSMKQTLARRKLCSQAPVQAALELRWAVLAMALLGLMGVKAQLERGGDPQQMSFASVVRVIRLMMRYPAVRCGRHRLARLLKKAIRDVYVRRRSKRSRGWAHKKNDPPPGLPRITTASEMQRQLAQTLEPHHPAA